MHHLILSALAFSLILFNEAKAQSFDPSAVDKDLYKHQKVGQPYKIMGKRYKPKHDPKYDETGLAQWYGDKFHGKLTATGETFDKNGITAAHRTLPLNSMVLVTNLETGQTLTVRLNDRGPFVGGRLIDLSEGAAEALGIRDKGLGRVRVQYAGPADPMASKRMAYTPSTQIPYAPDSTRPVKAFEQNNQTLHISRPIHLVAPEASIPTVISGDDTQPD